MLVLGNGVNLSVNTKTVQPTMAETRVQQNFGICASILQLVRQQDAYLAIRPAMTNKCVSRTDTNPPFAFQTAFPRGTDFTVFLQGGSKSYIHCL